MLQMENISNFLTATAAYGLPSFSSFQPADLYENCNMTQVRAVLCCAPSLVLCLAKSCRLPRDLLTQCVQVLLSLGELRRLSTK